MARNGTPRKQTITYYFSVEGETEQWYLEWLEAQINANENASYIVKIVAKVQKDPVSFVKKLTVQKRTTIWHLSDIEGSSEAQLRSVNNTLGRMKDAKSLGKSIIYKWGYSNLSFDLWMILHKQNCNSELSSVNGYLSHINRAFDAQFESMRKYKEEANFKHCLEQLTLQDVLAMKMSLTLKYKGKTIISYSSTTWWITGFNPKYINVSASSLTATFTIWFNDSTMYEAFQQGDTAGGIFYDSSLPAQYVF